MLLSCPMKLKNFFAELRFDNFLHAYVLIKSTIITLSYPPLSLTEPLPLPRESPFTFMSPWDPLGLIGVLECWVDGLSTGAQSDALFSPGQPVRHQQVQLNIGL